MVFRNRNRSVLERRKRTASVEPGRSDETIDGSTRYVLDERSTLRNSVGCIVLRQAQEFALARCHEPGPQAIFRCRMPSVVAMEKAMQENLDASLRPGTQTRGEG